MKRLQLKVLLVLYYVLCAGISLVEDSYPYLRETIWAFPTRKRIYYHRATMRDGRWSGEMNRGRKLILTPLINPLHQLYEVSLLIPLLRKLQLGEVK